MKPLLFIVAGLLAGNILAWSADPARVTNLPPLPPGPLLKRTEAFSIWQITYTYAADKEAKAHASPSPGEAKSPGAIPQYPESKITQLPAVPRTITITRTKPLWLAETIDVKGHKLVDCSDGQQEYMKLPAMTSATLFQTGFTGERDLINFGSVDFPDLEWVSAKTFAGIKQLGSASYLIFTQDDMTAWIDLESRLPVQWQKGSESRTFLQLPPPSGMLVFPPEILKLMALTKTDRDTLKRRPPRGG